MRTLSVLLAILILSLCYSLSITAANDSSVVSTKTNTKLESAKRKIKKFFHINKKTKKNEPLYEYSLNKVQKLYDAHSLSEQETLGLFRNAFTTVTHLGDMITLSQAKGYGLSSEVELDAGQLIFPFFSLKTILSSEGSATRQKFCIIERKNIDINSSSPLPFALYKMYGVSTEVKGGVGVKAAVSPIPSAVTGVINNLEAVSIEMEASVSISASAKGKYLYVNKEKGEFYPSIIAKNSRGKFLAKDLLDFTKISKSKHGTRTNLKKWWNKKRNKVPKDDNHIRIWEAGGNVTAEAGVEATVKVNNAIGVEAAAMSDIQANLSYVHYDIRTIDSDNVAKIQNTGFVLKQVGASLSLGADATLEIAEDMHIARNQLEKVKEFSFVNSIQYKGAIYFKDLNKDKILLKKSNYVIGQSVSIARWKKYFIDDIMDYRNQPYKSPYVKMLAKKFHAKPSRIVEFLNASSIVLNESLYNEGIDPSAFLIETAYTVSNEKELMSGNNLSDDKIVSMKIRYRLSDDLNNTHDILKLGFNAGIAEFEIGLNKIEEAGSVEIIDLYDDSTNANRSVAYSLLY